MLKRDPVSRSPPSFSYFLRNQDKNPWTWDDDADIDASSTGCGSGHSPRPSQQKHESYLIVEDDRHRQSRTSGSHTHDDSDELVASNYNNSDGKKSLLSSFTSGNSRIPFILLLFAFLPFPSLLAVVYTCTGQVILRFVNTYAIASNILKLAGHGPLSDQTQAQIASLVARAAKSEYDRVGIASTALVAATGGILLALPIVLILAVVAYLYYPCCNFRWTGRAGGGTLSPPTRATAQPPPQQLATVVETPVLVISRTNISSVLSSGDSSDTSDEKSEGVSRSRSSSISRSTVKPEHTVDPISASTPSLSRASSSVSKTVTVRKRPLPFPPTAAQGAQVAGVITTTMAGGVVGTTAYFPPPGITAATRAPIAEHSCSDPTSPSSSPVSAPNSPFSFHSSGKIAATSPSATATTTFVTAHAQPRNQPYRHYQRRQLVSYDRGNEGDLARAQVSGGGFDGSGSIEKKGINSLIGMGLDLKLVRFRNDTTATAAGTANKPGRAPASAPHTHARAHDDLQQQQRRYGSNKKDENSHSYWLVRPLMYGFLALLFLVIGTLAAPLGVLCLSAISNANNSHSTDTTMLDPNPQSSHHFLSTAQAAIASLVGTAVLNGGLAVLCASVWMGWALGYRSARRSERDTIGKISRILRPGP